MNLLRIIAFSVVVVLLVLIACCGKHRSPGKTVGPPTTRSSAENRGAATSSRHVRAQEDLMLNAMPYEESLAYLEQKFKDMMLERYGIVIDENVSAA